MRIRFSVSFILSKSWRYGARTFALLLLSSLGILVFGMPETWAAMPDTTLGVPLDSVLPAHSPDELIDWPRLALSLLGVVALIWIGLNRFLPKFSQSTALQNNPLKGILRQVKPLAADASTLAAYTDFNIIRTLSLAPGRHIHWVEVPGEILIIGSTTQTVQLLSKLPRQQAPAPTVPFSDTIPERSPYTTAP